MSERDYGRERSKFVEMIQAIEPDESQILHKAGYAPELAVAGGEDLTRR